MKAGEVRDVAWARRQRGMRAARKGWKRVEPTTRMRRSRVIVSCEEMLREDAPDGGSEVMAMGLIRDDDWGGRSARWARL